MKRISERRRKCLKTKKKNEEKKNVPLGMMEPISSAEDFSRVERYLTEDGRCSCGGYVWELGDGLRICGWCGNRF